MWPPGHYTVIETGQFFPNMPLIPNEPWRTLNRGPHVTTSGIVFDAEGRFPIMYRSDKVRSAKNCWGVPSGLHELGFTLNEQLDAELREELGLELLDVNSVLSHGVYENIVCNKSGEDNWHWVIAVLSGQVKTLDTIINKEPEKHTEIRIVSIVDFDPKSVVWSPGLGPFLIANWDTIRWSVLDRIAYGVPI